MIDIIVLLGVDEDEIEGSEQARHSRPGVAGDDPPDRVQSGGRQVAVRFPGALGKDLGPGDRAPLCRAAAASQMVETPFDDPISSSSRAFVARTRRASQRPVSRSTLRVRWDEGRLAARCAASSAYNRSRTVSTSSSIMVGWCPR